MVRVSLNAKKDFLTMVFLKDGKDLCADISGVLFLVLMICIVILVLLDQLIFVEIIILLFFL